jgi:hypothetical protein
VSVGCGSVRGGHPTVRTPTAVPQAAANSHGVRGVRFRDSLDSRRGVGCRRTAQTRRRRGGATAAPQVAFGRLRWSRGPGRRSPRQPVVRTRRYRRWPAGHRGARTPRALRTPASAAGHADTAAAATLDSRQQHRPPPRPCPTGVGPQCAASASTPADRQIGRLVRNVHASSLRAPPRGWLGGGLVSARGSGAGSGQECRPLRTRWVGWWRRRSLGPGTGSAGAV